MPSYGRCLQYRTIGSNVERLGRSGPFKNAPGFPGQFQVTRHRRYLGCGHQPLPPGMLPPLVGSLARSALVNLQQCHHVVVALNTGQFAAMWKGWVVTCRENSSADPKGMSLMTQSEVQNLVYRMYVVSQNSFSRLSPSDRGENRINIDVIDSLRSGQKDL